MHWDILGRKLVYNKFFYPGNRIFVYSKHQVLVVQTLDSPFHHVNHYPADESLGNKFPYPLVRDLSIG